MFAPLLKTLRKGLSPVSIVTLIVTKPSILSEQHYASGPVPSVSLELERMRASGAAGWREPLEETEGRSKSRLP